MSQGHDLFRSGLITQAGKKKRNSDDLPPDLGRYVPLSPDPGTYVPLRHAENNAGRSEPEIEISELLYWQQLGKQTCQRLLQIGLHLVRVLLSWRPKELLYLPLTLILMWGVSLWLGEEAIFKHKIEDCSWDRWEAWVSLILCEKVSCLYLFVG